MKKFMSIFTLFTLLILLAFPACARDYFGPTRQESPAVADYAITPSDTVLLDPVPRGIYIGVGGNLKVMLMNSPVAITYLNVPQGVILPIRPRLIYATGTTASSLNAMY